MKNKYKKNIIKILYQTYSTKISTFIYKNK